MKNKTLKITTTFVCCIAFAMAGNAQVLKNRLNVYAGYSYGLPGSTQYADNGSFRFPSLYSNLKFTGFSAQGLYEVNSFLSAGLKVEMMKGSNWNLTGTNVYNGAEANFIFISPVLQVHSIFHENGILNRLRLHLTIQPTFGLASITIKTPLNTVQYEGIRMYETGLSNKTNSLGLSGSAGFEYSVNQRAGLFLNYSFAYYQIQSSLSMDKGFNLSKIEGGIFIRCSKGKRYYY